MIPAPAVLDAFPLLAWDSQAQTLVHQGVWVVKVAGDPLYGYVAVGP